MILVLVSVFCFALWLSVFMWLSTIDQFYGYCFCAVYLIGTRELHNSGWQSVWLRNSWVIRFLQRLLVTTPIVVANATKGRRTMHVLEPHGRGCHGFVTSFIPSNNGHIRLLASWLCFYIPILRELYLILGVIPASKESAVKALAAKHDIAVIPSGLEGLYGSVVEKTKANTIRIYKRGIGFCAFAIKHRLLVEPLLSFGENDAYWTHTISQQWPFLSTVAFFSGRTVQVRRGTRIDAAEFIDARQLADAVYREFEAIARTANVKIEFIEQERFF